MQAPTAPRGQIHPHNRQRHFEPKDRGLHLTREFVMYHTDKHNHGAIRHDGSAIYLLSEPQYFNKSGGNLGYKTQLFYWGE